MPVPRRYTTDAIVLSRFDLGEADRVLTLITPGGGKLKAIAKGIRRPTSRLGGSLEPFAELTVALARGRTFDVVTQVSVGHAWLRLRDDLESAATAWYLAELADRSLEERHAAEPLYALLRRAYELLDAGMAPGRVARWFEMHLLDELGVRPEVDRCVECDRVLESDERFRWVPPLGGDRVRALSGPAARSDRPQPRGAQAAQGLPAPRHRGARWSAPDGRGGTRESRPRSATSFATSWSGKRARWPSSTRFAPSPDSARTTPASRRASQDQRAMTTWCADAPQVVTGLEGSRSHPLGPGRYEIDGEMTLDSAFVLDRGVARCHDARVSFESNSGGIR